MLVQFKIIFMKHIFNHKTHIAMKFLSSQYSTMVATKNPLSPLIFPLSYPLIILNG